ncbi:MAG: hypothetical protein Kow0042_22140 [Calditrichia bacterium]
MFDDTFVIVYIPVLLWIIGLVILFIFLALKYPFGKWTKENPNPYERETFAMPRGTFRGILTISLLFLVMLLEVVTLRLNNLEDMVDKLLVAFQMMLAFYFGSKVMHHVTKADERKSRELSKVVGAQVGLSASQAGLSASQAEQKEEKGVDESGAVG